MQPERSQVFFQGLVAGLLGYATVALFFAVENALAGRSPFYTAALLGQALFFGLRDVSNLTVAPGPVLAFNGVHMLVCLLLGAIAAWLAYLSARGPQLWYACTVLFMLVLFHALGFLLMITDDVRRAVAPWALVLAGALASIAMAAYLLAARPELRSALRAENTE